MILTKIVNQLYDAFLTIAYPQPCNLCGQSIENREYGPACRDCWGSTGIFTPYQLMCWKCGVPALEGVRTVDPAVIQCQRCGDQLFDVARACGIYEGALRESALLLKRQPHLPAHLTKLLVAVAGRPPLNQATRLIPVPLHPDRQSRRGFNQASIIARAIGPALGLPVDEDSLIRTTASHKYRAGLDAKGRVDTVAHAFAVQLPHVIAGESILLVDDVFTTGATASSCSSALLGAGAKAVLVLTIARPRW